MIFLYCTHTQTYKSVICTLIPLSFMMYYLLPSAFCLFVPPGAVSPQISSWLQVLFRSHRLNESHRDVGTLELPYPATFNCHPIYILLTYGVLLTYQIITVRMVWSETAFTLK